MIQFNEQELSKIEDELYEALSHLEDAPDYEAEGSVNLLRVGQKMGQATQVIKHVNDIIGNKLRDAKLKSAYKDSSTSQSQIDDNIRQALNKHRSLLGLNQDESLAKIKWTGKTQPMPYDSPWDDEEGMQHGSRDY